MRPNFILFASFERVLHRLFLPLAKRSTLNAQDNDTSTKWPVNCVWNVSRSVFLTSKSQIKFYDRSDLSHPFTIMTNTFEALGFFAAVFRGQLR